MNYDTSLAPEGDDQTPNSQMLDAALAYASRGWPVLPIHTAKAGQCSCGHAACSSPGKHPHTVHGVHNAAMDEATVRQWWSQRREANLGIATGAGSGIVALDIDP